MKKKPILLLLVCLLMTMTSVHADEDWKPAQDKEGIAVWTRAAPGFPVHEFKAVTIVKSTLQGLVCLIMDTDHAPDWVFRTNRIELLSRDDNSGEFLVRVMTNFPWPLRDRDVVVQGNVRQRPDGVVTVTSRSAPATLQSRDPGYVHMPYFSGLWIFRPLGNGRIEVTLQGLADPGGIIPSGIVNLIIHETPYQTLRGLRRVIGMPRYQTAVMPQLREP